MFVHKDDCYVHTRWGKALQVTTKYNIPPKQVTKKEISVLLHIATLFLQSSIVIKIIVVSVSIMTIILIMLVVGQVTVTPVLVIAVLTALLV